MAFYSTFAIGDAASYYNMRVTGYNSTAGDGVPVTFSNNTPFTTIDQDHDSYDLNCAIIFAGAWWHTTHFAGKNYWSVL